MWQKYFYSNCIPGIYQEHVQLLGQATNKAKRKLKNKKKYREKTKIRF
jgi:hypothetical protein